MKINAKILVCYNSPVSIFTVYNGKPSPKDPSLNDTSESGFSQEIDKISKSLSERFTEVFTLSVDSNIEAVINKILTISPDVIFNFVESVEGISSYEYCMAGVYELLGIPYTGNIPSTLGNCLNKARTKNILKAFGINTPGFITIKPYKRLSKNDFNLQFPVILKLLFEDASIGISEYSVVNNLRDLNKQLKFLFETYKQEVIIEEYIDGRELNVAVLGNEALPLSEIEFKGLPQNLPKIVTYDGKWISGSLYYANTIPKCPAKLNKNLKIKIEKISLAAYQAMNCRDYARVDVRLNKKNVPYVIEVNPNPDISEDSGFARAALASGMKHAELLFTIANFALSRKQNDTKNKAS